jgi:hypothetical protein
VRDIPHAGQVVVVVRKPRLICLEPACGRRHSLRRPGSCRLGPVVRPG